MKMLRSHGHRMDFWVKTNQMGDYRGSLSSRLKRGSNERVTQKKKWITDCHQKWIQAAQIWRFLWKLLRHSAQPQTLGAADWVAEDNGRGVSRTCQVARLTAWHIHVSSCTYQMWQQSHTVNFSRKHILGDKYILDNAKIGTSARIQGLSQFVLCPCHVVKDRLWIKSCCHWNIETSGSARMCTGALPGRVRDQSETPGRSLEPAWRPTCSGLNSLSNMLKRVMY